MITDKSIESITEADLEDLISNKVTENKRLEYKLILPSNSDSDKKEFLSDISSFANAAGGLVIYGIREEERLPVELTGLKDINIDNEKNRLENIMRDGIDPRIQGIIIHPLITSDGNAVLIIHIPRSWSAPHMISYQKSSKFYSHNSGGKYLLDVQEIKSAFMLSEGARESIKRFRDDRLGKIVAGETPVPLIESGKIVIHLIPFGFNDIQSNYDPLILYRSNIDLEPMDSMGSNRIINFDGLLTYCSDKDQSYSYLQIFRNGSIESANSSIMYIKENRKVIASLLFERELIKALHNYLISQKKLGVNLPIILMISLINVKDYEMVIDNSQDYFNRARRLSHGIDRNNLLLPDILIENYGVNASTLLKPIIDMVWNAAGFTESRYYDKSGKWIGDGQ